MTALIKNKRQTPTQKAVAAHFQERTVNTENMKRAKLIGIKRSKRRKSIAAR